MEELVRKHRGHTSVSAALGGPVLAVKVSHELSPYQEVVHLLYFLLYFLTILFYFVCMPCSFSSRNSSSARYFYLADVFVTITEISKVSFAQFLSWNVISSYKMS